MDELIARRAIHPFLVALPYGQSRTFANDTEWANARAGPYEDFVLDTVRAVDSRWATRAGRDYRAIGGLSEGGYGAVNITLHRLGVFGVTESWSGYFTQTPTASFTGASRQQLERNSPAAYVGSMGPALRRHPVRAFLYQGKRDDTPLRDFGDFARKLRRAGASVGTGLYPGGHQWALWAGQLPHMLRFADESFAALARTP
jgi:S-formylglutathione hydrolase FrmB